MWQDILARRSKAGPPILSPPAEPWPRCEWTLRAGLLFPISPQSDQEPSPLVLVQIKLLDGYGLGPFVIRRFDRPEIFATAAHDDDAPASDVCGPFGIGTSGHIGKIMAVEREGESAHLARCLWALPDDLWNTAMWPDPFCFGRTNPLQKHHEVREIRETVATDQRLVVRGAKSPIHFRTNRKPLSEWR
jgi:hypothetical protein